MRQPTSDKKARASEVAKNRKPPFYRSEGTQGSNGNESCPSVNQKMEGKPVEITAEHRIKAIAFLADAGQIVTSDGGGRVRRWRIKDGNEVGKPVYAGSNAWTIAVSQDGLWIVAGTAWGHVTVWDEERHKKVVGFEAQEMVPGPEGLAVPGVGVRVVDISPDGTKIATASGYDARVWSLSTGQRLLTPFGHDGHVIAVKFSPNRHLATASKPESDRDHSGSVRVYDSHDGRLCIDTPIQVSSKESLAWASDGGKLFVLSHDGNMSSLDVSAGTTLSKWVIHDGSYELGSKSLASNSMFFVASTDSSVSFWDTTTHKQISTVIHLPSGFKPDMMTISANNDLAICGGTKIILWNLHDILPAPYCDNVSVLASKA